jgi:hypothetical protein
MSRIYTYATVMLERPKVGLGLTRYWIKFMHG